MTEFLTTVVKQQVPSQAQHADLDFDWQWMAEGVLALYPKTDFARMLVLSAGIHGNETAPIELLDALCQDLFSGKLELKVGLLLILGNPEAMRTGQRYQDYDLNRLFCGAHQQISACYETQRAEQLEKIVADFFASHAAKPRYHYDLHTAIRRSLLPTFALIPLQASTHDAELLHSIDAAELSAVVYHSTAGKTFSQFSCSECQAASVTLELGQAKAFGQNKLQDFAAIDQVLRGLVSASSSKPRQSQPIRAFAVLESIIKYDADFQLHLADSAPNFSSFAPGALIASQQRKNYIVGAETAYILFPNKHVQPGLRAGLILKEIQCGIDK